MLLGGLARPALERAGRIADGWVTSSRTDLSRIAEGVGVIRAAAAEAGRDPEALRIVCRGVVRAGAEATGPGGERLLLSGSYEQIKEDISWLASQGVTEVFYDLNWDPQVGSPNVDPAAATARAAELLDALAPVTRERLIRRGAAPAGIPNAVGYAAGAGFMVIRLLQHRFEQRARECPCLTAWRSSAPGSAGSAWRSR